jgi:NDP-sugar pyrophosphorylase family protein
MSNKRYRLTDETREYEGVTLYRIEALEDFGYVKKGDRGGFIEKEDNLPQNYFGWVFDDSIVMGESKVRGWSRVSNNSVVKGEVWMHDLALVTGGSKVNGNVRISDRGVIGGQSVIDGMCRIRGAKILGSMVEDGYTYYSDITDSTVRVSEVNYSFINDATLINGASVLHCFIVGQSLVDGEFVSFKYLNHKDAVNPDTKEAYKGSGVIGGDPIED